MILQVLTTAGANLDTNDVTGKPPVVTAWNNLRHFTHLVSCGCDVNSYKINGQCSLVTLAKLEEKETTFKRDLLVLAGAETGPGISVEETGRKQSYINKMKELKVDAFHTLTLRAICRIVVRKSLLRPVMKNVNYLCLPIPIIRYLKMEIL